MKIKSATQPRNEILRSQRGIALVTVLMTVMILLCVVAGGLVLSTSNIRKADHLKSATEALYIAEIGVERALNELNHSITPSTSGSTSKGVYTVSVTDVTSPISAKQIVATGYLPNQSSPVAVRGITALAKPSVGGGQFHYAGFGETLVKLDGGGITDSYDSANGPYGGANVFSTGGVASNGNIDISSFTVKGDATAGGTIDNPGSITGTVTEHAPSQNFPTENCPSGGYTPSVSFGGAGGSYDPATGVLKVTDGNLVLPAPGTYYFKDVSVSSGATLSIGNGSVKIYIERKLTIVGGTLVNPSSVPGNLLFAGCGNDTTDWALSSADAYATIYAMKHVFTLGGGTGDLYGSVYAKTLKVKGGAKIHYDKALGRGAAGSSTYSIVAWKESSF